MQQPSDPEHAPESDGEDEEAGQHMESCRLLDGPDGNFGPESDRSQGQHDDAREISSHGERDGGKKDDPLLPRLVHRDVSVKRADHHESEK